MSGRGPRRAAAAALLCAALACPGAGRAVDGARGAWSALAAGNRRFAEGRPAHPGQSPSRVRQTSREQHPVAAVLGCSDSRVSPEILFDQGIGDLFVVREAGNVVDDDVLGSLEYAVLHLRVPLIVVLGHESCGAVEAALHHDETGHIRDLVAKIDPAVRGIRETDPRRKLALGVEANVRRSVAELIAARPVLSEAVRAGKLSVVGAVYDLSSGKIRRLE